MAFCTECGNQVEDGAKFCGSCGTKMKPVSSQVQPAKPQQSKTKNKSTQRETVYEGEIHKCPNCGATLSAFVSKCSECGYELRGAASSNSVQEFSYSYANAKTNAQKVDLIRTFVIPNTREDILEFVILASSNIDSASYSKDVVVSGGVSQQDVTEAWMAKFEQAKEKANLLLSGDPYLEKINKLYNEKKRSLEGARTVSAGKKVFGIIFGNDFVKIMMPFILLAVFAGCFMPMLLGGGEKKLEKQVKQIESYIDEGNYDAALTTAYAMSDSYSSSWSDTRASLISRILDLKGEGEDHTGKVKFPTESLVGKQVSDAISALESAGFKNVKKEKVKKDLLTGWMDTLLETRGEVDEITVNGSSNYSPGAWLDPNTPIIVRHW